MRFAFHLQVVLLGVRDNERFIPSVRVWVGDWLPSYFRVRDKVWRSLG